VHQSSGDVAVIDTATDTLIRNVAIDGMESRDVLATPDGRFVYVANYSSSEVSVIDTITYVVTNIATPAGPRRLAITPGGDRIFATDFLANSVSVIDTLTLTVIKNIVVGNRPRGIAITPDGRETYVTNVDGASVSVIDNEQLAVVATIDVGRTPWHLGITPDGAWAYVSNSNSQSVSIINTGMHAVVKTLTVGQGPFFSVVDPTGSDLYVSNAEDTTVSVIDLASQYVLQTIQQVGSQPFDLLFGGSQSPPPTPTATPAATETPTPTPTVTGTPTSSPTETPTPTPSSSEIPTPSPTQTPTPTSTPTPTPTTTPTPAPPSITTQPTDTTVNVEETARFRVIATGAPPLHYQWRKNGVDIPGATSSFYTTPATTAADDGSLFSVVVSNINGSVTSNNATLTVRISPTITTQPADQTVRVGQKARFSVTATGTQPLHFQWTKNGVNVSGATKASYTTPPTTAGDNGALFAVTISNLAASVTSNNAALTVR
jgi:YVTN family beta-propeller protein